jgi:mono/diheme cytochrome c family protein
MASIIKFFSTLLVVSTIVFAGCSGDKKGSGENIPSTAELEKPEDPYKDLKPMEQKGIGPVKSVQVGPIDPSLASKGKEIFFGRCASCHNFSSKVVGPSLGGVTTRRTPEWIMNMMLNPYEMTEKDPIGKRLLQEHKSQMTDQGLTEEDARAVLEYFREVDQAK